LKKPKDHIEQFDLSPLAKAGVLVLKIDEHTALSFGEHDILTPHRDKHYLLFVSTSGEIQFMLDFNELSVNEPAMLIISPGQVHNVTGYKSPRGWAIHFEPALIDEAFGQTLAFTTPLLAVDAPVLHQQLITLAGLMYDLQSGEQDHYTARSTHELLGAVLSLIAGKLSSPVVKKENRSQIIEKEFSKLLGQHYKTWKQPARYAAALAISVAHLNDTVKEISGHSVSAKIQEQSILEAKRLLYFTNLSVREIGYEVGYDNPVYFSKLFKKVVSVTPLEFRQQFRD
jgi:AraC family transcriptional regulator, transcriptional activator of pobA